jgi:hypothetical protein
MAASDRKNRNPAPREPKVLKMFEEGGETLQLIRLQRLRDKLVNDILFGLREAERTEDLDLVRELELKVEEARFVSAEINQLLNQGEK